MTEENSDWELESIAYAPSVRHNLNSDYIHDHYDAAEYAVFIKTDGKEIRLVPADEVEP
jgi:hypothetical protein